MPTCLYIYGSLCFNQIIFAFIFILFFCVSRQAQWHITGRKTIWFIHALRPVVNLQVQSSWPFPKTLVIKRGGLLWYLNSDWVCPVSLQWIVYVLFLWPIITLSIAKTSNKKLTPNASAVWNQPQREGGQDCPAMSRKPKDFQIYCVSLLLAKLVLQHWYLNSVCICLQLFSV